MKFQEELAEYERAWGEAEGVGMKIMYGADGWYARCRAVVCTVLSNRMHRAE